MSIRKYEDELFVRSAKRIILTMRGKNAREEMLWILKLSLIFTKIIKERFDYD